MTKKDIAIVLSCIISLYADASFITTIDRNLGLTMMMVPVWLTAFSIVLLIGNKKGWWRDKK